MNNVGENFGNSLASNELKIFSRLNTPQKIQDYLDNLPINFETNGETYMSPRRVIREKKAHCFEGALLAAAALFYHGAKPLLLDLQTVGGDEDHVVALFGDQSSGRGLWGAISKTNHSILRYRDPVYKTIRELAMSYFHEYMMDNGKKTLRKFSKPFDLSGFPSEKWVTAEEDLHWLVEALDSSPHFPVAPKNVLRRLRKASIVEVKAVNVVEWPIPNSLKINKHDL